MDQLAYGYCMMCVIPRISTHPHLARACLLRSCMCANTVTFSSYFPPAPPISMLATAQSF